MAVEGNYISDSDVDNWPSDYTDAQKLAVIQRVEDLVERVTHDYFYPKSFTLVLNGNGKNAMDLGLMPDILSITEVRLSGVTLGSTLYGFDAHTLYRAAMSTAQCSDIEGVTLTDTDPVIVTLTNHGYTTGESVRLVQVEGITPSLDGEYVVTKVNSSSFKLNGTDSSDYSGSFSSGTVCVATLAELHYLSNEQKAVFPEGIKNVRVAGTYGWTSCPMSISEACVILAKHENDSTLYTSYNDFDSERLGDYSYTRSTKYLTGVLEADRLLQNYVRKRPLLGAV